MPVRCYEFSPTKLPPLLRLNLEFTAGKRSATRHLQARYPPPSSSPNGSSKISCDTSRQMTETPIYKGVSRFSDLPSHLPSHLPSDLPSHLPSESTQEATIASCRELLSELSRGDWTGPQREVSARHLPSPNPLYIGVSEENGRVGGQNAKFLTGNPTCDN